MASTRDGLHLMIRLYGETSRCILCRIESNTSVQTPRLNAFETWISYDFIYHPVRIEVIGPEGLLPKSGSIGRTRDSTCSRVSDCNIQDRASDRRGSCPRSSGGLSSPPNTLPNRRTETEVVGAQPLSKRRRVGRLVGGGAASSVLAPSIAMPFVTSSFLLLVVMPFVTRD